MIWMWLLGIAVFAVGGLYATVLAYNAWLETKHSPKTPMFECPQHGLIPESVLLKLEGATDKPVSVCPFCFKDRMKRLKP